ERRALLDAEVDQRDAVGMIEPRGGARLALEAIDDAGAIGEHRVQELDDHGAADADALGGVDDAHSALGEPPAELVAALQHLACARIVGQDAESLTDEVRARGILRLDCDASCDIPSATMSICEANAIDSGFRSGG